MASLKTWAIVAGICLMPMLAQAADTEQSLMRKSTFDLGPVHIDRKYISMTGPVRTDKVSLMPGAAEGKLWVKGFRVDIADDKGAPQSSEYLCHAWLELDKSGARGQQLLTISEGLDEMTFPDGYAMPVINRTDNAGLMAQALNNNEGTDKQLTYKLTVSYLDDAAARQLKITPLRGITAAVMAKDANTGSGTEICRAEDGILAPPPAKGETPSIVHFDVPPGRHEYTSIIPRSNEIYQGGAVHYIKLHLHPYGESVSLIDKTTGKTLWTGHVKTGDRRVLLTDVDYYSSAEGFTIDPAHEYAVKTIYNNTTDKLTDAMAVLRVYLSDDGKKLP